MSRPLFYTAEEDAQISYAI